VHCSRLDRSEAGEQREQEERGGTSTTAHHTNRSRTTAHDSCLAVGVFFEVGVGEVGLCEVRVGRSVIAARAVVMVCVNGVKIAAVIGTHASFAVQFALRSTFVRRQGSELRVLFVSDEPPHVTPELRELARV
jgi:hypothetical protein